MFIVFAAAVAALVAGLAGALVREYVVQTRVLRRDDAQPTGARRRGSGRAPNGALAPPTAVKPEATV
jgi:hypothetical protein